MSASHIYSTRMWRETTRTLQDALRHCGVVDYTTVFNGENESGTYQVTPDVKDAVNDTKVQIYTSLFREHKHVLPKEILSLQEAMSYVSSVILTNHWPDWVNCLATSYYSVTFSLKHSNLDETGVVLYHLSIEEHTVKKINLGIIRELT